MIRAVICRIRHADSRLLKGHVILALLQFLMQGHAQVTTMQSSNPEPGVFQYTFQHGGGSLVHGLEYNSGTIQLYFPGSLQVEDLPGWQHEIHSSGRVMWTVTNGLTFVEAPITFQARSCLSAVKVYSGNAPNDLLGPYAAVLARYYSYPDHRPLPIVGYEALNYLGPALPTLFVEQNGTNIILRGSDVSPGFVLETSSDLALQEQWSALPDPPSVTNFEVVLRLPAFSQSTFFRLRYPCLE